MSRRCPLARRGALALLLVGLSACGSDAGVADADDGAGDMSEDVAPDLTGKSVYHLSVRVSDSNETLTLDRDLSGREETYFAFGSSHIGPAVSLAMTDSVTVPRTVVFTINFGIVVASAEHPIDIDGVGSYGFSDGPPELELALTGLQYRSRVAGSSGGLVVDAWSITPGEAVSGSFSGLLVQDTPSDHKRQVEVEGWFHFTLPSTQDGQPH